MFKRLIKGIIFKIDYNVPIQNLIYSDERCYRQEGFGGRPIKESPLRHFFYEYLHGDKEIAFTEFCKWYANQFTRYGAVGKRHGGMRFGSLHFLIEKKHLQKNIIIGGVKQYDKSIIDKTIRQMVAQRFALADSIVKEGYVFNPADPIIATRKGNGYILRSGHHRCCILAALGKDYCPQVFVPRGVFGRYLYLFLRELKWLLHPRNF